MLPAMATSLGPSSFKFKEASFKLKGGVFFIALSLSFKYTHVSYFYFDSFPHACPALGGHVSVVICAFNAAVQFPGKGLVIEDVFIDE